MVFGQKFTLNILETLLKISQVDLAYITIRGDYLQGENYGVMFQS